MIMRESTVGTSSHGAVPELRKAKSVPSCRVPFQFLSESKLRQCAEVCPDQALRSQKPAETYSSRKASWRITAAVPFRLRLSSPQHYHA